MASVSECYALREEAAAAIQDELRSSDIPTCAVDADCSIDELYLSDPAAFRAHTFNSDTDGCWPSCARDRGSLEYIGILKQSAARACAEFYDRGCRVQPVSCPPGSAPREADPTDSDGGTDVGGLRCVAGACRL